MYIRKDPLLAAVAVHAIRPRFSAAAPNLHLRLNTCESHLIFVEFCVPRASSSHAVSSREAFFHCSFVFRHTSELRLKLSSTARTRRGPRTTRCRFLDSWKTSRDLTPDPYLLTSRSSVRGCPLDHGRSSIADESRRTANIVRRFRNSVVTGHSRPGQYDDRRFYYDQGFIAARTGSGSHGTRLKPRCSPSCDGVA